MRARRHTIAAAAAACLIAPLLLPTPAGAQQFNGPNLRYPEHALEREAIPWGNDVVKEQVEATEAVIAGLARHHLFLIPNPPRPPMYAANGTQFGDLTPEKVCRVGLFGWFGWLVGLVGW
jgi:hypothetical protein